MKLIQFNLKEKPEASVLGAITDDNKVVDLQKAYKYELQTKGNERADVIAEATFPSNSVEFLKSGDHGIAEANRVVDYALSESNNGDFVFNREDVKLQAPVQTPGKMLCVGHNYREHILEMGRDLPEYPVTFAKFANTIIGADDDIPYYPISEQLDYEAEFAFVIGKEARNVKQEDALDYVAGYTIANDVTYRDIQRRTLQWLQGKAIDGSAPLGPWLVTKDELPNPSGLDISLSVNGEERQRSNTGNLVFSVERLVEFFSGLMTLEPGDLILSGTPGGVGFARDPQVFLKDGDVCRIEVDKIGVLENKVKKQ